MRVLGSTAGASENDPLACTYLGPAGSTFAATVDTVLLLEDGYLPAHKAYLCTDGVWPDMVSLGLQQEQPSEDHRLRLPLPGCERAETAQLLRIIYSHNRWDFARSLDLPALQQAGKLADKYCMVYIKEAVEDAILNLCFGPSRCDLKHEPTILSMETVYDLAKWADKANPPAVAVMCGRYIGAHALESNDTLSPELLVWVCAVCEAKGLLFDPETFRFQQPYQHRTHGDSNWRL